MSTGIHNYPKQPFEFYDPRWFDEVDFTDIETVESSDQIQIQRVFSHYQSTLFHNPRAMEFFHSLGIHDHELLRQWSVGYADQTLMKHLPNGDTREGARIQDVLQRHGLLLPGSREFFRDVLVFPHQTPSGEITAAYGQRIVPQPRFEVSYPLYWSSGLPVTFFNHHVLGEQDEVVLCMNPMDALLVNAAGYDNVVAVLGARGFDIEQVEALAAHRVRQVTLVLDNTPAGDRMSRLIAQTLSAYGITCFRPEVPQGCDLVEYVRHHGVEAVIGLLADSRPCRQSYERLKADGVDTLNLFGKGGN